LGPRAERVGVVSLGRFVGFLGSGAKKNRAPSWASGLKRAMILRGREGPNGDIPPLTHDRVSSFQTQRQYLVDGFDDCSLLYIFGK